MNNQHINQKQLGERISVLPKEINIKSSLELIKLLNKREIKIEAPSKTEPPFIGQPKISFKSKEDKIKKIHTKLPSLPNLPKNNRQFYNKWYIPYDLRYVQKPDLQKENFEDDLHFYKNIHSINVQYNPFDEQLPEVLIKNIGYRERTETVKDLLKGQRQIIEFKKQKLIISYNKTKILFGSKNIHTCKFFYFKMNYNIQNYILDNQNYLKISVYNLILILFQFIRLQELIKKVQSNLEIKIAIK